MTDVCVEDMRRMLKDRLRLVLLFLGAREEPAADTSAWSIVPLDRKALEKMGLVAPLQAEQVAESVQKGWMAEALGVLFQQHLATRSSVQSVCIISPESSCKVEATVEPVNKNQHCLWQTLS